MAKALNQNPMPAITDSQYLAMESKARAGKSYCRSLRRVFGAIRRTRISRNPAFTYQYAQVKQGDRQCREELAKAVDSLYEFLLFNHCLVSGAVYIRSQMQIAIQCGLATFEGKIVTTNQQYQEYAASGREMSGYINQNDISVDDMPRIGKGRLANAFKILYQMKAIRYYDTEIRHVDGVFVPRTVWVNDQFYGLSGLKGEFNSGLRKDREYMMRRHEFLKRNGLVVKPKSIQEARVAAIKAARVKRLEFYQEQRQSRNETRYLRRLKDMEPKERRHTITRIMQKRLIKSNLLPPSHQEMVNIVEREIAKVESQLNDPPNQPRQTAARFYHH